MSLDPEDPLARQPTPIDRDLLDHRKAPAARHVWIFNHYAQTPSVPGGTRHYSLGQALPQYGWTATIIAASTGHGTELQRLGRAENTRYERYAGVGFQWLRASSYEGNGLSRLRNMLEYSVRASLRRSVHQLQPPDVVVGSCVHPFAALAALRQAQRFGVPFVYEIRDLWPQTLVEMGQLDAGSWIATALYRLEHFLCSRAERIVALPPFAGEYLEAKGINKSKVTWISNGIDLRGNEPQPLRPSQEEFHLMYLGALGQANGLDCLLDAMAIVQANRANKRVVLRMIGTGPLRSELAARAEKLGLSNVHFEGQVPKSLVAQVASEADAFILTVRDLPELYKYGISMNKLYDYLAAARPIILASNARNNPVKDACAGITVPAEAPALLAKAILEMASLPPEERETLGQRGRRHVEAFYSFETLAGRFASVLTDALLSAESARTRKIEFGQARH